MVQPEMPSELRKKANEARVTFEPMYKQEKPGSDCPQGTEALDSGLCEKKSRK